MNEQEANDTRECTNKKEQSLIQSIVIERVAVARLGIVQFPQTNAKNALL